MQKEPDRVWRDQGLALASHAAGKTKGADAALAEFIEKYQNEWAFQIAEICAYRGETDKAFEWLERAYKQRDGGLSEMKGDGCGSHAGHFGPNQVEQAAVPAPDGEEAACRRGSSRYRTS